MNIIVTGGTGYIGSHTVVELIRAGHRPIVIDNLSNSHRGVLDAISRITGTNVEFHLTDLCNRTETFRLIREIEADAVIHFAAFKAVGESVRDPQKYYRNNIVSMVNLVDAVIERGIRHFIFSSSCTVYGNAERFPVTEDTPHGIPTSPYGATKQICERILGDATRAYGLKGIALRYFNPAGAHESALIGEYPLDAPNNLVPIITRAAVLQNTVDVFGNDYDTPDGTCIRDYIHVVDVAKAHTLALSRCLEGRCKQDYEVFNLGSGEGHSVLEVLKAFQSVSGKAVHHDFAPRRQGDVARIQASTSLAEKELDWKAQHSLEDIVRSAWNWELQLQSILAE